MEDAYLDSLLQMIVSDTPRIDASVKNLMTILMSNVEFNEMISQSELFVCARTLLQTIQSTSLKSIDSYLSENPQETTQTADNRLTEVCRYKVVWTYRESIIRSNKKVSQSFGRLYFVWANCWNEIKIHSKAALIEKHLDENGIDYFLQKYEKSLFDHNSESSDSDLIWADNFNAALQRRQKQRAESVSSRLNSLVQDVVVAVEDNGDREDQDNEYSASL